MLCLVTQSCLTLCDPHGLQPARLLYPWGFSRQEYWSGLPCPPPGDLSNTRIKPRSSVLQVDSLQSEPPGKSKNTGVGSLSLLQGIFPTQGWNWGLLQGRQVAQYKVSYPGGQIIHKSVPNSMSSGCFFLLCLSLFFFSQLF